MSFRASLPTVLAFVLSLGLAREARAEGGAPDTDARPEVHVGRDVPGRASRGGLSTTETGLAVFGTGYGLSVLAATSYRDPQGRVPLEMFVPVVGPWMTLFRQDRLDGKTLVTMRLWNATIAKVDWSEDCRGVVAVGCVMGAAVVGATVIGELVLLVLDPAVQGGGLIVAVHGATSDERRTASATKAAPARVAPKISFRPAPVVGPASTGLGASLAITQW